MEHGIVLVNTVKRRKEFRNQQNFYRAVEPEPLLKDRLTRFVRVEDPGEESIEREYC